MCETNFRLSDKESEHLNRIVSELDVTDASIQVAPGSNKGDNYIGQIYRITVDGTRRDGTRQTKSFILKASMRSKELRETTPMEKCYQREIYMYETVLPTFETFQADKGMIVDAFNNYPRYLSGCLELMNEFLLMHDLKPEGFCMTDRKNTLDLQHAAVVMEALGKYHALSYALRDQRPEVFKMFADNTGEFFLESFDGDEFREQIRVICEKAAKSVRDEEEDVGAKFKRFAMDAYDVMVSTSTPTDQFAVISHGDCWSNNLLFKYEGSPRRPTRVHFVDWQESRYITPACDLSMFMYNCASRDVLFDHFDELINIYYSSLADFLNKLGSAADEMLPRRELQNQIRKYFKYGLATACYQVNLVTADSEDIPDLETAAQESGSVLSIINLQTGNESVYNERMNAVITHAAQHGFI